MLAVVETHPIQYHAPVYRALRQQMNIPVMVIYGSDFSVAGYRDKEFGASFAWDTDLLSGYESIFLSRVSQGGARSTPELKANGLGRVLRKIMPDVVLLSGYASRFERTAILQTIRGGYPILFRGETTDHARRRSLVKSQVRDLLLTRFYEKCQNLLFIGERSYQHYKRLGCSDDKLIFSPYCVDNSAFATDEASRSVSRISVRKSLGLDESQKVLLFSGKLVLRKGPDLMLQAIKDLDAKSREKIVVLFLGSGELQGELERLASSAPFVKAVFLGFKNQRELSPYYNASDLLVVPSRFSETWGLVVNDALHHGLPCVVSTAVGCAPDLIVPGETGEVFETGLAQSLTSSLQRALRLIGREDVRDRCLKVVEGYTVENAAQGIAKAYRSSNVKAS